MNILEKRFDLKTRSLTAFLFLLQRGLSTGITIYAPAIVLSTILKIDITYTTSINGWHCDFVYYFGRHKSSFVYAIISDGGDFFGLNCSGHYGGLQIAL
jgi:SSS family solute:Na+ symporter